MEELWDFSQVSISCENQESRNISRFLLTSLDWGERDGSELESQKEEEYDAAQSQGVLVVDPRELEVGEGGPLVVGGGHHVYWEPACRGVRHHRHGHCEGGCTGKIMIQ